MVIEKPTPDQERYERASQRVEVLRGFYSHAIVFVLVNIGLVAHGAYAMGSGRFLGPAWQERRIREEMDREQRRSR